jgi:pseudomonalisin/xanthomonalisin
MTTTTLRHTFLVTALMTAALCAQAQPGKNWRGIQTRTPDTSDATSGADMQSGESVHVAVSLSLRNRDALEAYANSLATGAVSTPLTSAQFLASYAPTQADVDKVVAYLRSSGYVNIEVSSNNLLVTADGTASTAKQAFNVNMRHYKVNGRSAYANTNDAQVPQELSSIVLGVQGLQTVQTAHTALSRVQSSVTYASSGKTGHSPTEWPTIYNATSLPTAANTSIGIITAGSLTQTQADLATFVKQAGYATPVVSIVNVASASRRASVSTSDYTAEWDIDAQDALGAAGGVVKSLIFYNAASLTDADLTKAYNAAVAANTAKVINVSLGQCETSARLSGSMATNDQIFLAAMAQGQTFVVASGDSGAYTCGGRTASQSYPAVSPYVIAVGGTSLTTSATGTWAAETVWACSNYSTCASNGGTGGGPSLTESAPSWQISSKVLGTSTKRGVPDLAFVGDPATGAQPIVNGKVAQYGGTSLAAPIFVGFWARIQSANNNKLAFPGPALYKYGVANTALFHDITSGSNGGYSAAKGWDYTTGFGSLDVTAFYNFIKSNGGF